MNPVDALPYAHGTPTTSASLKRFPIDFRVDEDLGFELSGEGEHCCLRIKKSGLNTDDVAKCLAQVAGVSRQDVSYAGMKDKQAVTTQWFSVHLPGKADPDWRTIESDEIEILATQRHNKKIKRGSLRGNYFQITLRDCEGAQSDFLERLDLISTCGVPNYFGEQRFGIEGQNLRRAKQLFSGELKKVTKLKRSLYLSSARSYLFNEILADRVREGTWQQAIEGDLMMLDGSHSIFPIEMPDDEIIKRVSEFDVHPTGALYGVGESAIHSTAKAIEDAIFEAHPIFTKGLEKMGLKMDRRPLRLHLSNLDACFTAPKVLELSFFLAKGCYATTILRELTCCRTDRV